MLEKLSGLLIKHIVSRIIVVSIHLMNNFIFAIIFIIHALSVVKINKLILFRSHEHHWLLNILNCIDLLEFENILTNSFENGIPHENKE